MFLLMMLYMEADPGLQFLNSEYPIFSAIICRFYYVGPWTDVG
jgi:hypothetical protein